MSAGVWPLRQNSSTRARRGATAIAVAPLLNVWRSRRRRLRVVGAVSIIVVVVSSQRRSLISAAQRLGRISPAWLALAVGAEIVSFLAAAELQHHLLAVSGTRMDRRSLIALSYAGTAMSATFPAGAAVSGRYTYGALTRRGASTSAAVWVLASGAVLSIVTLALLGLVGAQLRGLGVVCSAIGGLVGLVVLLAAVGALVALVWSSRHRGRLEALAARWRARWDVRRTTVARGAICSSVPTADQAGAGPGEVSSPSPLSEHVEETPVSFGWARVSAALGLSSANWLADAAALAIAFLALGVEVPWPALLLAYVATQLVTSVPFLPGSIGVAEGSLTAALVCAGVHPTAAVATVLVYRFVSFWLVLPMGWLAWTFLRRDETIPAAATEGSTARTRWVAAA